MSENEKENQWGSVVDRGVVQARQTRVDPIRVKGIMRRDRKVSTLIVVESICHRISGESPEGVRYQFSRELQSNEETWQRRFNVTTEWQPLPLGWIADNGLESSMVRIQNEEGKFDTIPTPEQQAECDKRIVEIKYDSANDDEVWLILPQESFRGCPKKCDLLVIRSQYGQAKVSIIATPA